MIWLCVEDQHDGAIHIHGDTGRGGFAEPFQPDLCQFGGWRNHREKCGFYHIILKNTEDVGSPPVPDGYNAAEFDVTDPSLQDLDTSWLE